MKKYQKSFPAKTNLDKDEKGELIPTFLNNPKVNGELYAYLLSISIGEKGEARVYKKNMLSMTKITSDILHVKSRQTSYNHFKYLLDNKYIEDKGDYYLINNKKEQIYFQIPQDLIVYFLDTLKEPVVKTYIYLGQRNNYKPNQYVFTIKEICEHLGLSTVQQRNRNIVKNCLQALIDAGLIKITSFYEGNIPKMRLTYFTTDKPYSKELKNNSLKED